MIGQGPVVQSVVSLTSSLRVISLTVLADSIYNILIFFQKKFQHICVSLDVNFNKSLTNDIVSFEQLGPVCCSASPFWKGVHTKWANSFPKEKQVFTVLPPVENVFSLLHADNIFGIFFQKIVLFELSEGGDNSHKTQIPILIEWVRFYGPVTN